MDKPITHSGGEWSVRGTSVVARYIGKGTKPECIVAFLHPPSINPENPSDGQLEFEQALKIESANGKLIAAAPDLLAALKNALTSVESMHERVGSVITAKRLEACRGAIAKAEGN